jgi:hypothetical protein
MTQSIPTESGEAAGVTSDDKPRKEGYQNAANDQKGKDGNLKKHQTASARKGRA